MRACTTVDDATNRQGRETIHLMIDQNVRILNVRDYGRLLTEREGRCSDVRPRVKGTLQVPLCRIQCTGAGNATLEFALGYLAKKTVDLALLRTRSLRPRWRVPSR